MTTIQTMTVTDNTEIITRSATSENDLDEWRRLWVGAELGAFVVGRSVGFVDVGFEE